MVYEQMMNLINESGEYDPWKHALSGGIAGAMAATITMPWDVMKTLLNTQEANVLNRLNTRRVVGIVDAFRTVRGMAGYSGFYKGWKARVIYQAPSTAISWSVSVTKFGGKEYRRRRNTLVRLSQHPYNILLFQVGVRIVQVLPEAGHYESLQGGDH